MEDCWISVCRDCDTPENEIAYCTINLDDAKDGVTPPFSYAYDLDTCLTFCYADC